MYLSPKTAFVRNVGVATLNGAITLIILLIAPMGLAGVIFNTLLVTLASFANATLGDRIVLYLQPRKERELNQLYIDYEYNNYDNKDITKR